MRLAIVGAGVSGLAAAWALRNTELDVVVFEKSQGYSGRAATRGQHGVRYDHGANYFKIDSERVEHLICSELPTDELVEIPGDVWTFDAEGQVQPGDDDANAASKWTYRNGISTIGKLLAEAANAVVHRETRVEHVERQDGAWRVRTDTAETYGPFDAVLLTPPAPQTIAILQASEGAHSARTALVDAMREARYPSQFTVVLGYDQPISRPGDFFALLNLDRKHPIAWLSFEEDKPGHVPDGQSVLIVQMAPHWTEAHYEASHNVLVDRVVALVEDVLDTSLAAPTWSDHQRWRYALPNKAAATSEMEAAEAAGLFVAGDALVGKGRVQRALGTGLDAATQIREYAGST